MRLAVLFVACLWAGVAAADLYRWVDPETGSVKFSSYPPPWYGDEEREKRAPKVEHILPRGPGANAEPEPVLGAPRKPVPERQPALERQPAAVRGADTPSSDTPDGPPQAPIERKAAAVTGGEAPARPAAQR